MHHNHIFNLRVQNPTFMKKIQEFPNPQSGPNEIMFGLKLELSLRRTIFAIGIYSEFSSNMELSERKKKRETHLSVERKRKRNHRLKKHI